MIKYLTTAFLTCWVKDISQEEFKAKILQFNVKNLCIGQIEKTENENEHFHVVIKFNHSIRFDTLKNICASIHIESVKSSNSIIYSCKEGFYYNDFELNSNNDNNLYDSLINDMLILSWTQLVRKYPKLILSHYDNLFKMFKDLNK